MGSMFLWQVKQPALFVSACARVWDTSPASCVLRPACAKASIATIPPARRTQDTGRSTSLERENDIGEHMKERLAPLVDVFESLPRLESGDAADDHHVVVQVWPVARAEADVFAEVFVDVALEENGLDGRGGVEGDGVRGEDRFESRRDVDIDARGQDAHARVDEVRLPLVLAAAQRRQER